MMTNENRTLKAWTNTTSIFTLLIYIGYFIVFRMNLDQVFTLILILFLSINFSLIAYTLFFILKFRNRIDRFFSNLMVISFRLVINLLLGYLILSSF